MIKHVNWVVRNPPKAYFGLTGTLMFLVIDGILLKPGKTLTTTTLRLSQRKARLIMSRDQIQVGVTFLKSNDDIIVEIRIVEASLR